MKLANWKRKETINPAVNVAVTRDIVHTVAKKKS